MFFCPLLYRGSSFMPLTSLLVVRQKRALFVFGIQTIAHVRGPRVRRPRWKIPNIATPRQSTHPDRRLQMAGMNLYHPTPSLPRGAGMLFSLYDYRWVSCWCFGVSNQPTSQRRNPPRSRGMIPNFAADARRGTNRGGVPRHWTTGNGQRATDNGHVGCSSWRAMNRMCAGCILRLGYL